MSLVETIISNHLPYEIHMAYDVKGMHKIQQNFFEQTSKGHTLWTSHQEFIPQNTLMKLLSFFMKGAFKKQSMNNRMDFKRYVEEGILVAND